MHDYTKKDILKSLLKVGLKKNDLVYINPELFNFGIMKDAKNKEDYYKTFLNIILDVIGSKGTLVTNTYSFQTLRYKKNFIYEKTACSSGTFSEILRKKKNSIRSEHPAFSVSAIGKYKNYICKNNSHHNYGYNSPYQKFIKLNGKILNLAISPAWNPFLHVSEFKMGVPYYYNKLISTKYFKNKKKIKSKFIASVRYLNLNLDYDLKHLENQIFKKKIVKSAKLGKSQIFLFNSNNYISIALKFLEKDILAFVKKIKFKNGQYPLK